VITARDARHLCGCCWLAAVLSPAGLLADSPAAAEEALAPRFAAAFGSPGEGDGQFKAPVGIAINAADELLITDPQSQRVQRFTREGVFIDKHAALGLWPGGIAIDRDGMVYVAVMMAHKISVFRVPRRESLGPPGEPAKGWELVREWGQKGTAPGEFDQPGGLAFAADGTLYVCDQVNHRVQRFTSAGKFLAAWGEYNEAGGQFGAPEPPRNREGGPCFGAFDREGNFYTTEPRPGRIQKFSPDGKFLASWGTNDVREGAFGGNPGLKGPVAILFDRQNRMWISSTNHRAQLFATDGTYLAGLGTLAKASGEAGQFNVPHSMAFDSHGDLHIVDTLNRRVQRFTFDAK
jgi:sugar lactone lactonase YvrE